MGVGCSPSAPSASPRSLDLPRAADVAVARHAILREALSLFGRRPGVAAGGGNCVAVAALRSPALLPQPGRGGRAASHVLRRDAGSVSPLGPEEGRQPSQALSPISKVSHEMSKLGGNADGQSQMP